MNTPEHTRIFNKRSYLNAKARGVCVRCRKEAPEPNSVCCEACNQEKRERQKMISRSRVERGLCYQCGSPVMEGRTRCKECIDRDKRFNRKAGKGGRHRKNYYQERRVKAAAAGLCTSCGKNEPVEGRRLCQSCVEKCRKRNQAVYHRRIEAGKCPRCGKEAPIEGGVYCRVCLDKFKAMKLKHDERRESA